MGISFKEPHHQKSTPHVERPLGNEQGVGAGRTLIAAQATVFSGYAGMNFTAKLPFYGMMKGYAVF